MATTDFPSSTEPLWRTALWKHPSKLQPPAAHSTVLLQRARHPLARVTPLWQLEYRCGRHRTEIRIRNLNHHSFRHLRMSRVCRHSTPHPLLGTALPSPPYLAYFITPCRSPDEKHFISACPDSTGHACSLLQMCWDYSSAKSTGGKRASSFKKKPWWSKIDK